MVEIPRNQVQISPVKYRWTKNLAKVFKRWCEGVSWILSLQSYMFGDNQEAVVEAEEVRAEEEEEEEEQGEVEYKVCFS